MPLVQELLAQPEVNSGCYSQPVRVSSPNRSGQAHSLRATKAGPANAAGRRCNFPTTTRTQIRSPDELFRQAKGFEADAVMLVTDTKALRPAFETTNHSKRQLSGKS